MLTCFQLMADGVSQRLAYPGSYEPVLYSPNSHDPLGLMARPACDRVVVPIDKPGWWTLSAHVGGMIDGGPAPAPAAIEFGIAVNGGILALGYAVPGKGGSLSKMLYLAAGHELSVLWTPAGDTPRRLKAAGFLYPVFEGAWHGTTGLGPNL